jgi:hypothetical protein
VSQQIPNVMWSGGQQRDGWRSSTKHKVMTKMIFTQFGHFVCTQHFLDVPVKFLSPVKLIRGLDTALIIARFGTLATLHSLPNGGPKNLPTLVRVYWGSRAALPDSGPTCTLLVGSNSDVHLSPIIAAQLQIMVGLRAPSLLALP